MTLPAFVSGRLRLPMICSPLFIISNPDLVIAQCKAGVIGSFPALNARPASQLDEWLHRITEELAAWDRANPETPSAPFAVNQIVHRTNDRLDHDMEMCAKYKVPLVITSLGAREDVNAAVHAYGGITMHDVIDDRFARKAVEKGADGLIAVCTGAGGHAGRLSPFAFVQEIRRWFHGPLALSGSIANGQAVLAAQAMGADFAYIGSLFIASEEANAQREQKQMIVDSAASDIVYTNLFTGVHGNYLAPSIVNAGMDPDNLPESDPSKMYFGSGGNSKAKVWRDIWGCGQGIGVVDAIEPASVQIERLANEYEAAKRAIDRNYIDPRTVAGPKIISGTRKLALPDLNERALRAAGGLQALGLAEGDTVAMMLRNDFAFFEAMQAANLAGAYPVPINWHSTADEAGYIINDSGAKALIVHADLLPRMADVIPDDLPVFVVPTPPEICAAYRIELPTETKLNARNWDNWVREQTPIANPTPADRVAIIYTSGTTGRPKGVRRLPDENDAARPFRLAPLGLDIEGPFTVLVNGPLYHAGPNVYARTAMREGASLVLQAKFDAEEMLALIEEHRITHMHIVPTMFVRLLQLPADIRARYDVSSLRFVLHGAAPCPPEIKRAMIEWWGPVIHEYYGSSETGFAAWHDSSEALSKKGTVGRALPDAEIQVLDDDRNPVGPGVIGEVFIRSTSLPDFTYIGQEDKRRESGHGEFVTVGDVGYLDEDGYLFLCDRKRDMIISGGVNIYSAEIEAALLLIDGVKDCAVFGIPDTEFGESVCAYIEQRPGSILSAHDVRNGLEERISRFKLPRLIEFVDALPREDSGKIFKRKLRDPYWADRQTAI